jgi:hypothetical protein
VVTAITVSNSNWDLMVLPCDELEFLGPSLEDIVVHLELRDPSSSFGCRVVIQYKYENGDWSTVTGSDEVLAEKTTADYHIGSPFSDRSRLGRRRIRFMLQYHAQAGGSAGAKGVVSVSVACRPFCC